MAEGRRQHPEHVRHTAARGSVVGATAHPHAHPGRHHDSTAADHTRHDRSATAPTASKHAARKRGHDHSPETTASASKPHGTDHATHDTRRAGGPAHGEVHHAAVPPEPAHGPDKISKVQGALNQQGFDVGTPDGKLGKRTVDAVKAFQKKRGFKTTGKLDHATVDAILAAASAPSTPGTTPQQTTPQNTPPAASEGAPAQPNAADPATTGQGGAVPAAPPPAAPIERVPAETPQNPSAPDPSAPPNAPSGPPQDNNTLVPPGR